MKKAMVLICALHFLTGCFMDAKISSTLPSSSSSSGVFSKTNSLEAVSGGSKYERTALNGYKVRHSVGALFSKQVATTPQGYKVYSQVQGRISADEDKQ